MTEKLFCEQCGEELEPGSRFCEKCGAEALLDQEPSRQVPSAAERAAPPRPPVPDTGPLKPPPAGPASVEPPAARPAVVQPPPVRPVPVQPPPVPPVPVQAPPVNSLPPVPPAAARVPETKPKRSKGLLILVAVAVLGLGALCLGAVGGLVFGWFPLGSTSLANLGQPASPTPASAASLTPVAVQAAATNTPVLVQPGSTSMPAPLDTTVPTVLPTRASATPQQGGARDLHEFSDDFSTAENPWKIVSDQSNGSFTIDNGVLDMTVVRPDKYLSLQVPWYVTQPVSDVVLSMTVTVQTPGQGAFGFFCRAVDSKNFYMVSLLPDARGGGEYRFYKDVEGQITHLTDWKSTDLLYGGEVPEDVVFSCIGSTLRLEVNRQFVDEVTDTDHASGAAHVFAVSLADVSVDNPYRITVDDFRAVIP